MLVFAEVSLCQLGVRWQLGNLLSSQGQGTRAGFSPCCWECTAQGSDLGSLCSALQEL